MSNKIQIPIIIKIVAWVMILKAFLNVSSDLKLVYETQLPIIFFDYLGLLFQPLICVVLAYLIFKGIKAGWYLSVAFIAFIFIEYGLRSASLLACFFRGTCLLFGSAVGFALLFNIINILIIIGLLFDRKNYFAAIDNSKK